MSRTVLTKRIAYSVNFSMPSCHPLSGSTLLIVPLSFEMLEGRTPSPLPLFTIDLGPSSVVEEP